VRLSSCWKAVCSHGHDKASNGRGGEENDAQRVNQMTFCCDVAQCVFYSQQWTQVLQRKRTVEKIPCIVQ
jgi:hypothetical protein